MSSFTALDPDKVVEGQPVTESLFTKVKNNLDDHETRIQSCEARTVSFPGITFRVNGSYHAGEGFIKKMLSQSLTVTGVRILIDVAGSSGSTQVDIKVKRGGGPFTSIFLSQPIIASSAGNDALSAAGTLDLSMVDLLADDILRLDITSAQVDAKSFIVRIDYTR